MRPPENRATKAPPRPWTLPFAPGRRQSDMTERRRATCVSFNDDASCFIAAVAGGYAVYATEPLALRSAHSVGSAAVSASCMYCTSNWVALVTRGQTDTSGDVDNAGGGCCDSVTLWDDAERAVLCRVTPTAGRSVTGVRLTKSALVVLLYDAIHIYSLTKRPQLMFVVETAENGCGVCSVNAPLIAYPARSNENSSKTSARGLVEISNIDNPALEKPVAIRAHNSPIARLTLSADGSKLVSASRKGTLLRVFSTADGSLLHQFRRGKTVAPILSVSVSTDGSFVCALSGRGTLHVFVVQQRGASSADNSLSSDASPLSSANASPAHVSFLKRVTRRQPYRKHIVIPNVFQRAGDKSAHTAKRASVDCGACCVASLEQAVIAVSSDGSYSKFGFSAVSKSCPYWRVETSNFLHMLDA